MRLVSKELDPAQRRQIGLRIHPEVRKRLKASAALAGETMEDHLHRLLVKHLGPPEFPGASGMGAGPRRGRSVATP